MTSKDKDLIYETYLNQSAIAHDQQRQRGVRYDARSDFNNSNLAQFSGLTGYGKPGVARLHGLDPFPSDEEEDQIVVKGYGTMSLPQLRKLIENTAQELYEYTQEGVYNIEGKAQLLALFAKTYRENNPDY